MQISYKTLKSLVPEITSPLELAQMLINHSAEVESITQQGEYLKDVYIGKILEVKKHPDADKLNLCQVAVCGETKQIVCGANNVRADIKVPVAVVGAQLAPDFVIKKAKLRGEVSEGMICSEDELGLIEERQKGIMELPDDVPLGMSMKEYLGQDDTILEIDNKAINHRPDMFSHIGVARDVATILGQKLQHEYLTLDHSHLQAGAIDNQIPEIVARYSALEMSSVANIPSPTYIKDILNASGIKSKGLLIDISNYSLYFYGQPTHLFDADTLTGNITVRYAKEGESFLALDDKKYELSQNDIVIADDKNILALAGIIGAKNHSVTNATTRVLIESANFPQDIVRKTGRRLGVRTDSLNVFEKGIPQELTIPGLALIAKHLQELLPESTLTSFADSYSIKQETITIPHDIEFTKKLIGANYTEGFYDNTLTNLGITINSDTLEIPFWRTDLSEKADIAEEIARIDGYQNVPNELYLGTPSAVTQPDSYIVKRKLKSILSSKGFTELYTYSFIGESILSKVPYNNKNLIALKNTLSEEASHMRPDGVVPLLQAMEDNIRSIEHPKLFEIENIYYLDNDQLQEKQVLSMLAIYEGESTPYFHLQKELRAVIKMLHVGVVSFKKAQDLPAFSHKNRSADIFLNNKKIGIIGEIDPKVAENFGTKQSVSYMQIDISKIASPYIIKYKEISTYQENNFDINFVLPKDIPASTLKNALMSVSSYIKSLELLDVFEDQDKLGDNRSITYKVYYQALDKTLDDSDKAAIIENMIAAAKKIGATLR